jgi:hypothetical protein
VGQRFATPYNPHQHTFASDRTINHKDILTKDNFQANSGEQIGGLELFQNEFAFVQRGDWFANNFSGSY